MLDAIRKKRKGFFLSFQRLSLYAVTIFCLYTIPNACGYPTALDGFDPGADNQIKAVAVQPDGKILVGGWFTNLAGQARNYLGRLNADGSIDNTFTNGTDNWVYSIAVQADGKILAGGLFSNLAGQVRSRIGRLNVDGSLDNTFTNGANGDVWSIAVQADGKILVGGFFTNLAGQVRNNLGRLNADGSLDNTFTNGADSDVNSIAVQADGKILVGGFFTNLAGQVRNNLGRLNADGSLDNTFTNGANDAVWSIAVQADGKILVGGWFWNLAGQSRISLGRLNADGSLDSTFTNGANASVYSIAVQADGKILVGGIFITLAGQARNNLGRLNADGSLDNSFTNGAGASVDAIVVQPDGKILVCGQFTTLAGQARNYIGRLYPDGSLDATLTNGANMTVYPLAVQSDGKILVGGNFTTLAGQARNYIGRLNSDGTLDNTFTNGAGQAVYSIAIQPDGKILVGGDFTTLAGQARNYIGRLNSDGALDNTFTNGASGIVYSLALQSDGKILVGGTFTTLAGQARNYIGRLNADGTLDNTFTNGASSFVYSLALQSDGKILVGGLFTTLAGQARSRIGRLNADGALDNTFTNGANNQVFSLALQSDGKILVGGQFTTLAGQARNNIGRLNADGTLDNTFTNGASSNVGSLAVQSDGKILVGGQFTNLAGQARSYIGRFNADGSLDSTFTNGANSAVVSLSVQSDGKILVGGTFTTLAGQARNYLGRLATPDAVIQSLTVAAGGTSAAWQRSGAGPEVWRTTLETSTNGVDWSTNIVAGTRITNGWEFTGLNLPLNEAGWVRARGYAAGGCGKDNGSHSIIESVRMFYLNSDVDSDGMPDDWEIGNWGNTTTADATTDFDGDGLRDILEFQNGTNPQLPDSDSDFFNDYIEVINGTDPMDPGSNPPYPYKEWTRIWGSANAESISCMTIDGASNVYVVGCTEGAYHGETNSGSADICLSKIAPNGSNLWTRIWGSSASDYGRCIATVSDYSRIYIAGETWGQIDGQTNMGNEDLFLSVLTDTGTRLWTRMWGSTGSQEEVGGIALDNMTNVYVCGSTRGEFFGQTNAGLDDLFVCKFNAEGSNLWTRFFGSTNVDMGRGGIVITKSGEIVVAGHTAGSFDGQTNSGNYDFYVVKLDSNGSNIWTRIWGSTNTDATYSINVDENGGIYVGGLTCGSYDGQTNAGPWDLCLTKLSSDGTTIWSRIWGTSLSDMREKGAIDQYGNPLTVGYTYGAFDGQTNAGGTDIFLTKHSSDGDRLWTRIYGTLQDDQGRAVASIKDFIYLAADIMGPLDGETNCMGVGSDFCLTKWVDQSPLTVQNLEAIDIAETSATLRGDLPSTGPSTNTAEVTIFWGTMDYGTNMFAWTNSTFIGTISPGLFSTNITGLMVNTQYYYRCYASNAFGTAWAPSTESFVASSGGSYWPRFEIEVPSPIVTGQIVNVTVTAWNGTNLWTDYTGTVYFLSADASLLPSNYDFKVSDNGTHVFTNSLSFTNHGDYMYLEAKDAVDPGMNGYLGNIIVVNGFSGNAVDNLLVWGIQDPIVTGDQSSVSIAAIDFDFRIITNYTGKVNFDSSDTLATLPGTLDSYTFTVSDAGVHTFTNELTFNTIGEHWFSAQDEANTNAWFKYDNITVQGVGFSTNVTHFVIEGMPEWGSTNAWYDLYIEARNELEQVVTGFMGTVSMSSSDTNAIFPPFILLSGADYGAKYMASSVQFHTIGNHWIEGSWWNGTTNIYGGVYNITVDSGMPKGNLNLILPRYAVAGIPVSFTVQAKMPDGNTDTNYTGTVEFYCGDPGATYPSNYTFNAGDLGVKTFSNALVLVNGGMQKFQLWPQDDPGKWEDDDTMVFIGGATNTTSLMIDISPLPALSNMWCDAYIAAFGDNGLVNTNHTNSVVFSSSDLNAGFRIMNFSNFENGTAFITNQVRMMTCGEQTVTITSSTDSNATCEISVLVLGCGRPYLYVNRENGSDSNDGLTVTSAWYSISYASSMIAAGDVVLVAPGVYNESITVNVTGNPNSWIGFIADEDGRHFGGNGGPVTIEPTSSYVFNIPYRSYIAICGFEKTIDTPIDYGIQVTGCTDIYLFNNEMNFCNEGIYLTNTIRSVLLGNELFDCTTYGIHSESMNPWYNQKFEANHIESCGTGIKINGTASNIFLLGNYITMCNDGIALTGSVDGEIYQNQIHDNYGMGISINGSGCTGQIHHNIIYNNDTEGIYISSAAPGLDIANNTLYNNMAGIVLSLTSGSAIHNNIIAFNLDYGISADFTSTNSWLCEYNCCYGNTYDWYDSAQPGTGSISNNPEFASLSPSGEDFHLMSTVGRYTPNGWTTDGISSPCIDAGDPVSVWTNEPSPNGGRINMGAYGNTKEASRTPTGVFERWIGPWPGANQVAGGYAHSLALKDDGRIIAWGLNDIGQCNAPGGESNFIAVAAGWYHSLGLKADGSIIAWGKNDYGQCNVPTPNTNFVAVSAGRYFSLGLKADGGIVAWGDNSFGQTNLPVPNADFIAISAGGYFAVGIRSNETAIAWGWNAHGETNIPPASNNNFVAIAAGYAHALGLRNDGTIIAWGDNSSSQCNIPAGSNSDFIAVGADGSHSMGLKNDGSIVAWGLNDDSQCDVPPPNTLFSAIEAGEQFSLGLKNDGSIIAWGRNIDGQTNVSLPNMEFGQMSGVVPPRGPIGGGSTVSILGKGLGNGSDVTNVLICDVPVTAIVSQSPRVIVVQTAAAPFPTNGDVIVFSVSCGAITKTNGFTYLDPDADGDGMEDAWEITYFGSTNNPSGMPENDTDNDGMNNISEYIAGTDPTNTVSVLKFESAKYVSGPGIEFQWASASNRIYEIDWSRDLSSNAFFLGDTNLTGTPPLNCWTSQIHRTIQHGYYRLSVLKQGHTNRVFAVNLTGYARVDVEGIAGTNYSISSYVSYPFNVLGTDDTVRVTMDGHQLHGDTTGNPASSTADELWWWKNSTWQTWIWLMDGLGPTWDFKWWDENTVNFSTGRLAKGQALWLRSKQASNRDFYIIGEVPVTATQQVTIVSGWNLVSYPYPITIAITHLSITNQALRGMSYGSSDEIRTGLPTNGLNASSITNIYWLPVFPPSSNWRKYPESNDTCDIIPAGSGFWYFNARTNTFVWSETRPYPLSFDGPALPLPLEIANAGASNIRTNSANLNGILVLSDTPNSSVYVYWGASDGGSNRFAWSNSIFMGAISIGSFQTNITGLTSNSTYYYRCYASNALGTAWAPSTITFTTPLFDDIDSDGIGDVWETTWFGSITNANAETDYDGDRLRDVLEFQNDGNPMLADSDSDSFSDYIEFLNKSSLTNALSKPSYPYKEWSRMVGSASSDQARSVCLDSSGMVYVAVWTSGSIGGQTNSGGEEACLIKYSPAGNIVWTRMWGSTNAEETRGVAFGGSGVVYVTGDTSGAFDGETNPGNRSPFLSKYSTDGVRIWSRIWGSADLDAGNWLYGINVDSLGDIYVTGDSCASIDGQTYAGGVDPFLTKYSPDGTKQWTRMWGGIGGDYGDSVAIDSSNYIYVSGNTFSSFDGQTNSGPVDLLLTKYAPDGTKQWTKLWGSTVSDMGYVCGVDALLNVYVAGGTMGSFDGQTSAGDKDACLTKFSDNGTKQWTKLWGSSAGEECYAMALDIQGNVYVAGSTSGSFDGQTNTGSSDMFLTKYTSTGTRQWSRIWGSSGSDQIYGMAYDTSGAIYTVGYAGGAFDCETFAGGNDVFITKWIDPPLLTVQNLNAINITTNSATLRGDILATGPETNIANAVIYWGPTDGGTNAPAWTNNINLGILGIGPFSTNITGLSSNTTYYYRIYASNPFGTTWASSTTNFTTAGISNTPPTVDVTSPTNGSTFVEGTNLTITATATDSDGTISKVEFYQGVTKLGEDTSNPYSFIWTNVPAGGYLLTASATDNSSATTTSASVSITVNNADADSDGMPDEWEIMYFGNTNSSANGDYDTDSSPNITEYIAGTIPTTNTSIFTFTGSSVSSNGNPIAEWSSVTSRLYTLEWNTNSFGSTWQTIAASIPATPPNNVYEDYSAGIGISRFYRVKVRFDTTNEAVCSGQIGFHWTTVTNGPGGNVNNPTNTWIIHGSIPSFQATPSNGYSFTGWTGTITSTNNPLSLTATQSVSITANFAINTYGVTALTVTNGTISPTGTTMVAYGSDINYSITASTNYHITDVIVDASSIGITNSYTFSNVTNGGHTINATFAIDTYTLNVTSLHGAPSPSGITTNNWNTLVNAAVNSPVSDGIYTQYLCTGWTGSGSTPVSGLTTNTSFNITNNSTLAWNWKTQYAFSAVSGGNGSVVASNGWNDANSLVSATATASNGYSFVNWTGSVTSTNNPLVMTLSNAVSVAANFAINTYGVTALTVTNGTISPTGVTMVAYGSNAVYTITPATNYHIIDVIVDASSIGVTNSYTFLNVTNGGHTINATFAIDTYDVTALTVTNGTISPTGVTMVAYGSNINYAITPSPNYYVADVIVDSSSIGAMTNYTFSNVTNGGHTITATFAIDTYDVTALAVTNGTISPTGVTMVAHGSNINYSITASNNYHITDVIVDASSIGITNSYTFSNVTNGGHTINAAFAINTYTLNVTSLHGTPSPSGLTTNNWNALVNAAVNSPVSGGIYTQYLCTGWTGSGSAPVSGLTTNTSFNITNNSTLGWNWKTQYMFNAVSGGNGSVVASNGWNDANSLISATATASNGYHFVNWTGQITSTNNPLSLTATQSVSITANFAINTYDVTALTVTYGTISPTGVTMVAYGSNAVYTITPATNYHITDVIVDASSIGITNSYTFSNVTNGGHTINATFAIDTYTLNVISLHGTPSPSGLTTNNWNTLVNATVNSPVTDGASTQYVCTGWAGSGSAPVSGLTTNTSFNITNNSTLGWNWKTQYMFNAVSGGNGSVVASNGWNDAGTPGVTATATPSNGYSFTGWTGSISATNNPIILTMNQAYSITANFTIKTYTINASAVANGSITPSGITTVNHGVNTNYNINPSANYHVADVLVDSVSIGPTNSYTFVNVTNNRTISASFAINTFTLTVNTAYGTANPSGLTTNNWNAFINASVNSPIPDGASTQYVCTGWAGSGSAPVSGITTNTSFNITANSVITWNWQTQYWLDTTAGANGTINVADSWRNSGSAVVITPTANSGYRFAGWTGAVPPANANDDPLTLTMDSARAVTANFAISTGSISVAILPTQANTQGAQWRLTTGPDTTWHNSGDIASGLPGTGTPYTVTFNTISGWSSPANITGIGITHGGTTTRSAVYVIGSMSLINGGTFMMGIYYGEGGHQVTVSSFYMDATEVTVGAFQTFCDAIAHPMPAAPSWGWTDTSLPMVNVTWNEASAYAVWAGKRLPTEAEYEYAMRSGVADRLYPWGNSISSANANYFNYAGKPRTAGLYYAANAYGLFDIAGNVWEWCSDWHQNVLTGPVTDPKGPSTGLYKIIRGGGWASPSTALRCAPRFYLEKPNIKYIDVGFRCVRSVGAPPADGDSNDNGIPDWWEMWYFGLEDGGTPAFNALADHDGDGMNNSGEYTAGTSPIDSSSLLKIDLKQVYGPDGFVIRWPSASGKLYTIERSTNLMTGFSTLATDIPASLPINSYTDTVGTGSFFYRVKIQP